MWYECDQRELTYLPYTFLELKHTDFEFSFELKQTARLYTLIPTCIH